MKSMFPEFYRSNDIGPTAEDIEKQRQAALRQKFSICTAYNVKIYDMHNDDDRENYVKQMADIIKMVAKGECVIWANERQVLTQSGEQRWYKYLEWSEYDIETIETPTVAAK